jgi:hypothetical protein
MRKPLDASDADVWFRVLNHILRYLVQCLLVQCVDWRVFARYLHWHWAASFDAGGSQRGGLLYELM